MKLLKPKISLITAALLGSVSITYASPSGGIVTSGSASISQNGLVTNINQSTTKASINWNRFNIKKGETVNFNQINKNSITLNRVIGNERSIINGALNAKGQVWILNSNGILFGKDARINTAGLLASTKNLSDDDFNSGKYLFKGNSSQSIINLGEIDISDSGYVTLIGKNISNEGNIKVVRGKVHLVGASEVLLSLNGNSLLNLSVKKGVLDALVQNKGAVYTKGGEIYLTTNALDDLLKGVVNNTGILEAQNFNDITGKIELFAHGGEVRIAGSLKAKDGFIETSGKTFKMNDNTTIQAKQWLIDPTNITVESSGASSLTGSSIKASFIQSTLNSGTGVTLQADNDIFINEDITWNKGLLSLKAGNDINVFSVLDLSFGTGTLAMNFDETNGNIRYGIWNETAFRGKVNYGARIGIGLLNINAKDYTIINTSNDIGNISSSQYYAIGKDIDFSSDPKTGDWISKVEGTFDGLGNTINNFQTTSTFAYQGVFARNYGTIRNIGVNNLKIINKYDDQSLSFISQNYSGAKVFGIKLSGKTDFTQNVEVGVRQNAMTGLLIADNYGSASELSQTGIIDINGFSIGGMISLNEGMIKNVYSNAILTIKATSAVSKMGAIVCFNPIGIIDTAIFAGTFNFLSKDFSHGYLGGYMNGIGGIVGYNSGKIKNSTFSGIINTGSLVIGNVGGIAGKNRSLISDSKVTGTINIGIDDSINIGGIVGYNSEDESNSLYGLILNSTFNGTINSSKSLSNVGGIVGKDNSVTKVSIKNSVSSGNINLSNSSSKYIGGIVGYLEPTSFIMDNKADTDIVSVNGLTPTIDIGILSNNYHGKLIGNGSASNIINSITNYTLSDILSGYIYNGAQTSLSSLWNSETIFGSSFYNSWIAGTDYNFIYNGNIVTGFKDVNTYSGISINVLKADFSTASTGNTSGTLKINPKAINISGLSASNKTYDGTTDVNISSWGEVSTGIGAETLTLNHGTAKFLDKKAGTLKSVKASGYSLADGNSGGLASNYYLPSTTASTRANISKKDITLEYLASNKVYDGTKNASVQEIRSAIISADKVRTSQDSLFDNKNVGISKTVNISNITLAGADANNYNLTSTTASSLANITKAEVKKSITVRNPKVEKTITAIINTVAIKAPVLQKTSKQNFTKTKLDFGNKIDKVTIVSKPILGEKTKKVTQEEVRIMQNSKTTIVPIGRDSLIQLINSGVTLPQGVQQEFYVVEDKRR